MFWAIPITKSQTITTTRMTTQSLHVRSGYDLTRPLVNNFQGMTSRRYWHKFDQSGVARTCATHGKPIAQQYGYGNDWIASVGDHMSTIVAKDSPVLHNMSKNDAPYVYAAGPPYLLTASDMYKVVTLWREFVPKIQSASFSRNVWLHHGRCPFTASTPTVVPNYDN